MAMSDILKFGGHRLFRKVEIEDDNVNGPQRRLRTLVFWIDTYNTSGISFLYVSILLIDIQ